MKNFIYLTFLFSLFSCNNDDLLDFYSSQNRSVEFLGKWKQIEAETQPNYFEFTGKEYLITTSPDDVHPSKFLWYNDEGKVYYIRNGKGSKNDARHSVFYTFSVNKDTLKTSFGSNEWETYIKIIE